MPYEIKFKYMCRKRRKIPGQWLRPDLQQDRRRKVTQIKEGRNHRDARRTEKKCSTNYSYDIK